MINDNVELDLSNAEQIVCSGGTITPMVITAANANDTTVTGLPATLTYNSDNGTITGTVHGNENDVITFTVRSTGLYGCGDSTVTGKITISAQTVSNVAVHGCGSYHWTSVNEDRLFTASKDTVIGPYTSAGGCDSVNNLQLHLRVAGV